MRVSRHQVASSWKPDTRTRPVDLEQVYAQYLDPIYHFLYTRVGNREDAEDLASQVFLKAFHLLDVSRAERSIAVWLFTVARTVLADHWRQEYRHGPWAELNENMVGRANAPAGPDDAETVQRVDEMLALLPLRSRAVLELRFLHDYTITETAHALGITPGNVKVIQHRALSKAADLMRYDMMPGSRSAPAEQAIA